MDGADGSTAFIDESGKTWTAASNAQIDTAESKFGGASGLFDGTGDMVSCTSTGVIDLANDFTVSFWVRPASDGTGLRCFVHFYNSTGDNNGLNIYRNSSTGFLQVDNGLVGTTAGTEFIALNTWTHIEVTRASGTIRGFVDGVLALSHSAQSYPAVINLSSIGMFRGNLFPYEGHIDEFMVDDTALHTADFTPPTTPY